MPKGKVVRTAERKSLIGERIFLRPFEKGDLTHFQRWENDAELRKLIGEVAPMSRMEVEKWYEDLLADQDRVWFAIVLK